MVLAQHLCCWHSGRPHMKQTKSVRLITMLFFVVVDISAEESTDRVSCTCLLKVSHNTGKCFILHILYCLATASGDVFSGVYIFGLPRRSLTWVFSIFCLYSSQLLKAFLTGAWRKKHATGNTQDMMVQRKTIPCCLSPVSRVSDIPACTFFLAHPLCLWSLITS